MLLGTSVDPIVSDHPALQRNAGVLTGSIYRPAQPPFSTSESERADWLYVSREGGGRDNVTPDANQLLQDREGEPEKKVEESSQAAKMQICQGNVII